MPAPGKRGWRRLPWWVWVLSVVLVGGSIAAIAMGSLVVGRYLGEGWKMFDADARVALQRNPTIRTHIGTIREMQLNVGVTGHQTHPDDFTFDLTGDRGEGRVSARFESMPGGGERIAQGKLKMRGGEEWPLAPDPGD